MNTKGTLQPYLAYLKKQSENRINVHRRKIEDIHQDLVGRRGIDLLQEQAFTLFMDQCRSFLREEIDTAWQTIEAGLSNPYPQMSGDTAAEIYTELNEAVAPASKILGYFDNFAETRGRPQYQKLVDRLYSETEAERSILLRVKQVEISKFLELVARSEAIRVRAMPTYFEELLRWVKNKPLLVWLYLSFITLGSLGGLFNWWCAGKAPLDCVTSIWVASTPTPTPTTVPLPTLQPTLAPSVTPTVRPTVLSTIVKTPASSKPKPKLKTEIKK